MTPARRVVAVVAVLAVLVAGAVAANRWAPAVPASAGSNLVGRAVLTGPITADATAGVDAASLPRSPAGSDCLTRIARPAGPMDLCWQAWRDPQDADPAQDYYRLRVYGTFGGNDGSGVRWVVLRAGLVGKPSNEVFDAWPRDTVDGPCQNVTVSLRFGPDTDETVCGRTVATIRYEDWSQQVTWTCESCLFPDHATRAVALQQLVAVAAGTVPSWEIFADLGG